MVTIPLKPFRHYLIDKLEIVSHRSSKITFLSLVVIPVFLLGLGLNLYGPTRCQT